MMERSMIVLTMMMMVMLIAVFFCGDVDANDHYQ
jgi:hypothetical protein